MTIKRKKMDKKKIPDGFTLMEILIAIAIIGILAGVVLVSMTAFRSKARSAKALASLSSAIPSMVGCWGNGGTVYTPPHNPSRNICSLAASYGQWPQIAGDLSSYSYSGSSINNTNKTFAVLFTSGTDNRRVCCNSKMNNCKLLDTAGDTCNPSTPSY